MIPAGKAKQSRKRRGQQGGIARRRQGQAGRRGNTVEKEAKPGRQARGVGEARRKSSAEDLSQQWGPPAQSSVRQPRWGDRGAAWSVSTSPSCYLTPPYMYRERERDIVYLAVALLFPMRTLNEKDHCHYVNCFETILRRCSIRHCDFRKPAEIYVPST